VFSAATANLGWLTDVDGVQLVNVSYSFRCFLLVSSALKDFFIHSRFFSHLEDVQIVPNANLWL
jgi:hypothetical protein